MQGQSIGQAIRNAIEVERAAARYYARLVARAADDGTRAFFEEMVRQEEAHADQIERMSERLVKGALPASADAGVELVETAPGWADVQAIELQDAVGLAIEAEHQAALYYDAMADCFDGEGAAFFGKLTQSELKHVELLKELLASL